MGNTLSSTATPRNRRVLIALLAFGVAAVAVSALWRLTSGGDDNKDAGGPSTSSSSSSSSAPTEEPTETPTPTATPSCEGPDTTFEDAPQDSLLPDCGAPAVTVEEQQKSGLGLGCGGKYPVILYKTTTSAAKTSICGTDATGENFRMVTRARGGKVIDMSASYDSQRDAFVAKNDGTSYAVLAYNGSLVVTKGGQSETQTSDDDWISLDNERDGV